MPAFTRSRRRPAFRSGVIVGSLLRFLGIAILASFLMAIFCSCQVPDEAQAGSALIVAITPQDFQTVALTWLTVASVVIAGLFGMLFRFWPQIVELKTRLDALHGRVDRQSVRQNTQDQTIATVALATQPGGPPALPAPSQDAPGN